jgi:hypothetical protein
MLSSHWNHVFSCSAGMIFSDPSRTASVAFLAIPSQFTYHCGVIMGSRTSPERLQMASRMALGSFPTNKPFKGGEQSQEPE